MRIRGVKDRGVGAETVVTSTGFEGDERSLAMRYREYCLHVNMYDQRTRRCSRCSHCSSQTTKHFYPQGCWLDQTDGVALPHLLSSASAPQCWQNICFHFARVGGKNWFIIEERKTQTRTLFHLCRWRSRSGKTCDALSLAFLRPLKWSDCCRVKQLVKRHPFVPFSYSSCSVEMLFSWLVADYNTKQQYLYTNLSLHLYLCVQYVPATVSVPPRR